MNILLNDLKKQGLTEKEAREYKEIDIIFRQGSKFKEDLQIVDYYYLQRELLSNTNCTITDEEILISSENTIYLHMKGLDFTDIKDILKLRKQVTRQVKEQGHKVSYKNGYKKRLEELEEQYNKDCKKYTEGYKVVINRVKHIKERGLHMGVLDDYYLKETQKIAWDMQKMLVGGSAISQVNSIKNTLNNHSERIHYAKTDNVILTIYL